MAKKGYSTRGFFGTVNHYDKNGKKIGSSSPGFFGGTNHYDANGKKVATGSFKTDPVLTVQPNSTKPWTFIFPAELVNAEDADFSRWTARVPQN